MDTSPPTTPATITRLLEQMKSQGDFPAVGRFLTEVTAALQRPTASGQQIANLILKDFALTNVLLRTVNSAFFPSQRDRPVSTVSHAVLLLGVDTVANLAVGLRLLEHFNGPGELRTVRTLMLESLLTGVHAREIAQAIRDVVPEEAFIAGLVHDLGRLSVAYYLPDAYTKVSHRAARLGITPADAATEVLETSFAAIGQAVAQAWRFPDSICATIPPPENLDGPTLPLIVEFARELTALLATVPKDDRPPRLAALRTRYEVAVPVRAAELERLVTASAQRLQELLGALRVSARELKEDATPPRAPLASDPNTTPPLVLQAVEDISQALGTKYALNDVLMMVLEGMYRGVGCTHAVLLLVTPQRDLLRARRALGDGADGVMGEMQIPRSAGARSWHELMSVQRDVILRGPCDTLGLPAGVVAALAAHETILLPIVVNTTTIGALYVDRAAGQPAFSDTELKSLRLLRDQAVLAVRLCRAA